MNSGVRNRYSTKKGTINSIKSQLQTINRQRTSSASSSDGCYIATMAYGDYDHPQVMILRKFRDETLSNTFFGRRFINFYYTTSPHLVKLLKNQKHINRIIRNLLDQFVNNVK